MDILIGVKICKIEILKSWKTEFLKLVFIVQVLKERHYNNTLSKIGIFVEFVAFFYQPVVVAAKRRIRRVFRS